MAGKKPRERKYDRHHLNRFFHQFMVGKFKDMGLKEDDERFPKATSDGSNFELGRIFYLVNFNGIDDKLYFVAKMHIPNYALKREAEESGLKRLLGDAISTSSCEWLGDSEVLDFNNNDEGYTSFKVRVPVHDLPLGEEGHLSKNFCKILRNRVLAPVYQYYLANSK